MTLITPIINSVFIFDKTEKYYIHFSVHFQSTILFTQHNRKHYLKHNIYIIFVPYEI